MTTKSKSHMRQRGSGAIQVTTKRRKMPGAKASSRAAECPLLPLMQRMNELLRIQQAMDDDKVEASDEMILSVADETVALADYATILCAASMEGALFQLGLIADKLQGLDEEEKHEIRSKERAILRLVFSIAAVLAKYVRSAASEPAITSHLPPWMDIQTRVEKQYDAQLSRNLPTKLAHADRRYG